MNDAGRYVTGHYINYTDYMSGRRPTRARRVLRVVHGKDYPKPSFSGDQYQYSTHEPLGWDMP